MTKSPTSRGKRPVKVPVHMVMDALRTIHDKGDSDHFMKAAKKAEAVVTVHPKTLDFVKSYLTDNNLDNHPATKKVVACPHPYYCPPPDNT